MEVLYIFLSVAMIAMLYDIRRDIRLSQQSLERITAIAQDVSDKTDAILGRLPRP